MPGFLKEPDSQLAHRLALVLLALAALAFLAAFGPGSPPVAVWLAAFAGATFPVALIALGMARAGRLGRLGSALILFWLFLAGGLAAILALPHGGPDIAGLPLSTALMIFVLVPVPLLGLGLLYAFTFDCGLRPEDLEKLRRLRGSGAEGP
ncbi:MAG: hypothetical protein QOF89_3318 [Acidobacteriota bacterium]|jgi:hypothetical protein|nr:hypothetical protein [Acidobacteriota bacterium]